MTCAFLAASLYVALPVILEPNVLESASRRFHLPICVDDEVRKRCEGFRLLVSDDQGKTWNRHGEITAAGARFIFTTNRDGQYGFVLQVLDKNGNVTPAKVGASADLKVCVNADKRVVIRLPLASSSTIRY